MPRRLLILALFTLTVILFFGHGSASVQKEGKDNRPADPLIFTFNPRLSIQVGGNGRFNIGAFPNSVGGAAPNSFDLIFRWPSGPSTSFSTLRIDGSDNVYGSSGTQIQPPTNIDSKTNQSKWQIGDIEVTQVLQLVFNNQTGQEDVAKIAYTVRNTGAISHTIGQRVMIDTEINQNDGAPYRIPGTGIVRTETEFFGAAIPDTFQAFFNVTDNLHVASGTLKSGGVIAPDRFVLASWPRIFNTAYDFSITPGFDFTSDSAYAVYWNPAVLAPGSSRTYVTFYGLSDIQVDLQPPLALGVTGPTALSVVNNQYSPNPFDVVATVFNNGNGTATNVLLTINLPAGLTLTTATSTISIGDLPVGQERQVSWNVLAAPQTNLTTLTYSVTASASNAQPKTLQRQITIPVLLSDSDGDGLPDDWEMNGYTRNGRFVDLPGMGANPNHKDIFVEIDYMSGHRPSQSGVIDKIRDSFARVPNALFAIPNPDGSDGITLHIIMDQEIPHIDQLGSNNNGIYDWAEFDQLKQMYFDEALSVSFHYCIFAHNGPRTIDGFPNSGISRGIPGNYFLVTLGSWPRGTLLGIGFGEGGTDTQQAGTLMHELGHNLGLCHGGPVNLAAQTGQCNINNKPNYLSIMNYSFQHSGLRRNGSNGLFDYSRFTLPSLNEMHLNENIGLNDGSAINGYGTTWFCSGVQQWTSNANGAINWNCNKSFLFFDIIESDIATDINKDNSQSTLLSFNDWTNLDFMGSSIGSGIPILPEMQTVVDEIDINTAKSILPAPPESLTARFELDGVHLSWNPAGPATEFSYRVYRSTGSGAFILMFSTDSASNIDTNPVFSTTNSYYVTAVNTLGSESAQSNIVNVSDASIAVLQDDSNGNIMRFRSTTGDYLWVNCGSNITLGGVGTLTIKGSIITLRHNQGDRRVLATLENSAKRGTASAQILPLGVTYTVIDRDTTNNSFGCR